LAIVGTSIAALASLWATVPITQGGATNATIGIGSGTVAPGGSITVDLVVSPTSGKVGALGVQIDYNPAVLTATAATPATCNFAFDADTVFCSTLDLAGLSGIEGTISFQAIGADGTSSVLNVIVITCGDEQGNPIPCADQDGVINVLAATPTPTPIPTPSPTPALAPLFGDINCDNIVNAVDALAILRWKVSLPVYQMQPCPIVGLPHP
jgi:hypothetical protein